MRGVFLPLVLCLLICRSGWASKSRVQALGNLNTSIFYFNDVQNIFLNPAYLNLNKDLIVFEWGGDRNGPELGNSTPKGEGGFFKTFGYFNYGVYFGHDGGMNSRDDVGVSSPPDFLYQDNSVELIVSGDAGIEWGGAIKISKNNDDRQGIEREQLSVGLNFGILAGPFEAFLDVDLIDKSLGGKTKSEEFRGTLGLNGGVSYLINEFVFHGIYSNSGYEYKRAVDGKTDIKKNVKTFSIGGGRKVYLNEKAKMYFDLTFLNNSEEKKVNLSTTTEKTKLWRIPVTLAFEAKVKDWLFVRGSLSQNLMSRTINKNGLRSTESQTTNLALGGTLVFDRLKVDGLLGTLDPQGNFSKKGILSLANLFTRTSLVYKF